MAAAAGRRCPGCGEMVGLGDAFCEACGRDLSDRAVSDGAPVRVGGCAACGSAQIGEDGYCEQCGHKAPSARDHIELDLGSVAGVTDLGLRHHRNEDAMALAVTMTPSGPAVVAVVCDGVSTSDRPDEASLAGADAGASILLAAVRAGGDPEAASVKAVRAARQAIATLPGTPMNAPSATYVSAVIAAGVVTACWVGDSRAYWLPKESSSAARLLTRDDSWAEEMVAAGVLSEADAAASPKAHVVTRWLGVDAEQGDPHVEAFEPPCEGFVLLCTDGLWNYRPAAEDLAQLTRSLAAAGPLAAAAGLVTFAIDAGGRDNVTAVLACFPPSGPAEPRTEAAGNKESAGDGRTGSQSAPIRGSTP